MYFKCPKCGTIVSDDVEKCPNCGVKLAFTKPEEKPLEAIPVTEEEVEQSKKPKFDPLHWKEQNDDLVKNDEDYAEISKKREIFSLIIFSIFLPITIFVFYKLKIFQILDKDEYMSLFDLKDTLSDDLTNLVLDGSTFKFLFVGSLVLVCLTAVACIAYGLYIHNNKSGLVRDYLEHGKNYAIINDEKRVSRPLTFLLITMLIAILVVPFYVYYKYATSEETAIFVDDMSRITAFMFGYCGIALLFVAVMVPFSIKRMKLVYKARKEEREKTAQTTNDAKNKMH